MDEFQCGIEAWQQQHERLQAKKLRVATGQSAATSQKARASARPEGPPLSTEIKRKPDADVVPVDTTGPTASASGSDRKASLTAAMTSALIRRAQLCSESRVVLLPLLSGTAPTELVRDFTLSGDAGVVALPLGGLAESVALQVLLQSLDPQLLDSDGADAGKEVKEENKEAMAKVELATTSYGHDALRDLGGQDAIIPRLLAFHISAFKDAAPSGDARAFFQALQSKAKFPCRLSLCSSVFLFSGDEFDSECVLHRVMGHLRGRREFWAQATVSTRASRQAGKRQHARLFHGAFTASFHDSRLRSTRD